MEAWTAGIGPALLTLLGVVGTLTSQAIARGRRDKQSAQRLRETEWDLLHRSRRMWIEAAMDARQAAREAGVKLSHLFADPWETRGSDDDEH